MLLTEREMMVIWINRGGLTKDMRNVNAPGASPQWGNRQCVGVIAHCGQTVRGGHWIMFTKKNNQWYKVENMTGLMNWEDPFTGQFNGSSQSNDDYTVNILFFKQ